MTSPLLTVLANKAYKAIDAYRLTKQGNPKSPNLPGLKQSVEDAQHNYYREWLHLYEAELRVHGCERKRIG